MTRGRRCRIIPASAGQTAVCPATMPTSTDHPRECGANDGLTLTGIAVPDHPRECGANLFASLVASRCVGSSPRVRGKRRRTARRLPTHRIIPASAGQTTRRRGGCTCRPDHPRECGANVTHCTAVSHAVGSSPRVRGKHGVFELGAERLRIIPASAGQTRPTGRFRRAWSDHPRECGANSLGC